MRALEIITEAYGRCNRLSPGETLNDDDTERGFALLNSLVDEMAAKSLYLFKTTLTSAAQTGHITLGAGAWSAIAPGTEIVGVTVNDLPLSPVTMTQYAEQVAATGSPMVYVPDGLSTVYLWPTPNGQTVKIQTRGSVATFVDRTTDYTAPPGYKSAMSAALAVRLAPVVIGNVPVKLEKDEKRLMGNISAYEPAIVDVGSFSGGSPVSASRLF